ncbi:MAG: hypothetical protein JSS57_13490 [Proteobacteria bacterium]|nr:hypothetical protein [Pseudomonadota bacterium]
MAADKDVSLSIGVEDAGLQAGLERAQAVVRNASEQMQGAMKGVGEAFQRVQGIFVAFTAALAGGAAFRDGIAAVKAQTSEAMSLAKTLGITSEEANVLNTALGNVFLDKDEYIAGTQAVNRALIKNGDAFKELGIKTKDARGHLLPMQQIIANTVAVLDTYKAGVDRNVMAQQLLGKSYQEVLALAKVNEQAMADAAQEVADYHKEIDPEQVKAYKGAMENLGDAAEGVTLAIGRGAMPIMTELANWLQNAGPTATEAMITAMDSLRDVYDAVKNSATTVWEIISSTMSQIAGLVENTFGVRVATASETFVNAFKVVRVAALALGLVVEHVFEGIRVSIQILNSSLIRLANVASAALRLDFAGAKAAWQAGAAELEKIVAGSAERILVMRASYGTRMDEALQPGVNTKVPGVKPPPGGNKQARDLGAGDDGKKDKKAADKSRMSEWEAELASQKAAYEQQSAQDGSFQQYTLSQELAFWEKKQGLAKVGTAEVAAIQKKVGELRLQILRKDHEAELQIDAINTEQAKNAALARVDADEQAGQLEVALGRKKAEEQLSDEQVFEDRRNAIRLQALQEKFLIAAKDPERNKVELARTAAEIEQLEISHQAKLAEIRGKIAVANANPFGAFLTTAQAGFSQFANSMLMRTQTLAQGLAQLYKQMTGAFISEFIVKKSMALVADQAKELALRSSTLTALLGLESASTVKTVVAKKAEAAGVIPAEAATAAGAAAASVAGIPVVGPAMAAAAYAETMAMVMGGLAVASASNGYDIPAGINPVTQLHQREMVLPAKYADVIRSMSDGGGAGAGRGDLNVTIKAQPMKSGFFMIHRDELVAALKSARRDFDI